MKPHIALGLIGLTCLAFLPVKGFEKQNITIRGSFDNSRFKFETKHTGRVAFIGGSITEMNGYRPMMMNSSRIDILIPILNSSMPVYLRLVQPPVPFGCQGMYSVKVRLICCFWNLQ